MRNTEVPVQDCVIKSTRHFIAKKTNIFTGNIEQIYHVMLGYLRKALYICDLYAEFFGNKSCNMKKKKK